MAEIPTSPLSLKQRRAVRALLSTGDMTEAAVQAGVHRDTLYVYLTIPAFVAELHRAEADALAAVSRDLVRLASMATATLEISMTDADVPARTRVAAANVVLARLLQLREHSDLEARLCALEQGARHDE